MFDYLPFSKVVSDVSHSVSMLAGLCVCACVCVYVGHKTILLLLLLLRMTLEEIKGNSGHIINSMIQQLI